MKFTLKKVMLFFLVFCASYSCAYNIDGYLNALADIVQLADQSDEVHVLYEYLEGAGAGKTFSRNHEWTVLELAYDILEKYHEKIDEQEIVSSIMLTLDSHFAALETGNLAVFRNNKNVETLNLENANGFADVARFPHELEVAENFRVTGTTKLWNDLTVTGSVTMESDAGILGNFAVNTDKFIVIGATGDTTIAGDVTIGGALSYSGDLSVDDLVVSGDLTIGDSLTVAGDTGISGDFAVNADKFAVASATGDTVVAGTLDVTGQITGNLTGDVTGSSSNNVLKAGDVMSGELSIDSGSGNAALSVTGLMSLTSTGTALSVYGSAQKTVGGTTWINASDRRIKENIVDADLYECLDLINDVNLKKFSYTADWQKATGVSDAAEWGIIAQELEEVLPDSVSTERCHVIQDLHTGDVLDQLNDFKTYSFDQISKLSVGAVQQLACYVNDLQSICRDLEARVQDLEKNK